MTWKRHWVRGPAAPPAYLPGGWWHLSGVRMQAGAGVRRAPFGRSHFAALAGSLSSCALAEGKKAQSAPHGSDSDAHDASESILELLADGCTSNRMLAQRMVLSERQRVRGTAGLREGDPLPRIQQPPL
jgi:hypothetical protein